MSEDFFEKAHKARLPKTGYLDIPANSSYYINHKTGIMECIPGYKTKAFEDNGYTVCYKPKDSSSLPTKPAAVKNTRYINPAATSRPDVTTSKHIKNLYDIPPRGIDDGYKPFEDKYVLDNLPPYYDGIGAFPTYQMSDKTDKYGSTKLKTTIKVPDSFKNKPYDVQRLTQLPDIKFLQN